MSRSVDLFVASGESLEELAATIVARTGMTLDGAVSPERADLSDGDLSAVLHEHQFVDDVDLVLRRYRYALSLRTTASGHLGLSPETLLLRRVAAALADHAVLLVLDLQFRVGAGPADEVAR